MTYLYEGPVMSYGRVVQEKYVAETYAGSKAKARNNLAYRWKKDNGRMSTMKVTLPGKITVIQDER